MQSYERKQPARAHLLHVEEDVHGAALLKLTLVSVLQQEGAGD